MLELFVWSNLAFLAVDVYFAHSVNDFALWEEWVPVYFSLAAAVVVPLGWLAAAVGRRAVDTAVGWGVGCVSIVVGVAGLVFHLHDTFFRETTLENLVYTAPFIAPLSYTGLGLLLVLNRSKVSGDREWGQWVLLLAWGGLIGNFVLSVADHAINGFFRWEEWIAVAASAAAVGIIGVAVWWPMRREMVWACAAVLVLQVVVGLLGFYYHVAASLAGPSDLLWENLIFNAPPFAPLLFANIAVLAAIGVWALAVEHRQTAAAVVRARRPASARR